MKFSALRLRMLVPPPQHPVEATDGMRDVFKLDDGYAIEDVNGRWLRITHKDSGKARLYPQSWCCGADELAEPVAQKQGGKR